MKKRIYLIIFIIALLIAIIIPANKVYALDKEIYYLNAIEENGKITVTGYAEDGCLAVAIQVLDEDDNLVTLETVAVDEYNEYNAEIELPEGTYIVKVADYDGGETVSQVVKPVQYIDEVNIKLTPPKAGDKVELDEETLMPSLIPDVEGEEEANYEIIFAYYSKGTEETESEEYIEPFEGTFEAKKDYYAIVALEANDNYLFADEVNIKVNGEDIEKLIGIYEKDLDFIVKVKIEGEEEPAETVEEKENNMPNPKTGDKIVFVVGILVIAIVGLIVTMKVNKKRNEK